MKGHGRILKGHGRILKGHGRVLKGHGRILNGHGQWWHQRRNAGGANPAKVQTVSEAKGFSRTAPIALAKKARKKVIDGMKVPTLHRSLSADEGISKIVGG